MDDQASGLHAAILAAGPATRFGGIKPLVRLRGEPVLHELAANAAFVAGQSLTVVIGAYAKEIAPSLRQPLRSGTRTSQARVGPIESCCIDLSPSLGVEDISSTVPAERAQRKGSGANWGAIDTFP